MIEIDNILRNKKINREKMLAYGFTLKGVIFRMSREIMDGQFILETTFDEEGKADYKVTDVASREEYEMVRMPEAKGAFVESVRTACEEVLGEIAEKCFDTDVFSAEQARRIADHIENEYGCRPEHMWERYPGYAVFRRKDNRKWFAIIMEAKYSKLGVDRPGNAEIIDMKAEPDHVEELLRQDGYYPAYHMNKMHWFTVCLDGSLTDSDICSMIDTSYRCAAGK